MLVLSEVAEKLENVLNSENSNLLFKVATQGFHLDKISDYNSSKNFIPCFISLTSGNNEPIPNLKQSTYEISVIIYFPVRFKNDFFVLQDKLNDAFCGKTFSMGELTGRCVSNISVARYGEIQDLDLKEFAFWVENVYKKEISVSEPYITMEFTLYIGTVKTGVLFGNNIHYSLTYKIKNDETLYEISDAIWDTIAEQLDNSPTGEQLINIDNYIKNVVNTTNRSKSLKIYIDNNDATIKLYDLYNKGELNKISEFNIIKEYGGRDSKMVGRRYEYNAVLLSVVENITKGEPLSLVLTFGDAKV